MSELKDDDDVQKEVRGWCEINEKMKNKTQERFVFFSYCNTLNV